MVENVAVFLRVKRPTVLTPTRDGIFDALSDLIATYEDRHYPIEPATDADMLRHLLDTKGVTQAELSRGAAIPKSSISEVLANKKPFSRQMIRKLADFFEVEVSILTANVCRGVA